MADKLSRLRLARAAQHLNRRSGSGLPPLVLMTDDERLPDPLAAASALPRGSMIVLRARDSHRRALLTHQLMPIVRERRLKLSVANDPELAQRIGADGIHFSESRARESGHWRVLRPHWIITVAAHSLAACAAAKRSGADAAFFSPVFPTESHPNAQHLGPVRAMLIARRVKLPLYALGGIDALTAGSLMASRFVGVAAVGALTV